MKTNNNIPAYRFQGYTGAWELRKLGEVVEVCSGRDYKHLGVGSIPVYGTGGYMLSVSEALSKNNDAIGIGRKGTIDSPYILRAPFWTVDTLFYCIPNDGFTLEFAYSIFQNINWKSMDESTGVPSLSKNGINNVKVLTPKIKEQSAIGTFFSTLDRHITLHQRKLDMLKEQKKTYLKLLFPAKGQTKPALRFQGFEDDWKEVKLGEVVSISSGYTGDATLNNGKYKLTRIETISEGKVDVSRTGFSNELPDEKYRLNFGDILFSNINSLVHIGKVAIFNTMEEVFHGINLLRLVPNKDLINPYFIYYQLVTESKKNWSKAHANQAVNQASINQTSLSTQKISISSLPEQEAIGTFFQTLDQEIAQVEDKLASLKEMKKTLLRKLFV
ncbi:restriction endonuclease subunit S [Streptococcus suis]|uniref:restriction endonuclease subunit S n=1 Tax=Streptococcus suis TaxID=1307 RepID=UPI001C94B2D3|nr:restriction endonuclease subunit S [Streptococcus suis]MBY4956442.1 restriction endonuclease subunit S [Streptococcus suis]MBY4982101.1 restriction endonuclease subunit S [Streptococcus suis]MBY4992846.1 restriction endonuclease subunit S [Streptococcus suis]MBY5008253.1 restriction endonuclease subunit S [Streptococcus suis]MBY5017565.1 restriction endonuclease subunit S [Streptococcus suis]